MKVVILTKVVTFSRGPLQAISSFEETDKNNDSDHSSHIFIGAGLHTSLEETDESSDFDQSSDFFILANDTPCGNPGYSGNLGYPMMH